MSYDCIGYTNIKVNPLQVKHAIPVHTEIEKYKQNGIQECLKNRQQDQMNWLPASCCKKITVLKHAPFAVASPAPQNLLCPVLSGGWTMSALLPQCDDLLSASG